MGQMYLETGGAKGSFLVCRHPDAAGRGQHSLQKVSVPDRQSSLDITVRAVETVTPASGTAATADSVLDSSANETTP